MLGGIAAWAFNICSSVGIIYVNKVVLSTYGFIFATTLTACHFLVTSGFGYVGTALGYIENKKKVPIRELFWFSIVANLSIVGMNMSLLLNTVGFYQIAKLSIIPVVCMLEMLLNGKTFTKYTIISVMLVAMGVAIVTVTDVTVSSKGFLAAVVAVISTSLQQIYIGSLQKKHDISASSLLTQTAPVQALSLVILGPFVDYGLNGQSLLRYIQTDLSSTALTFITLSCTLAVGCNISQYLVIGHFSATTFQVIGHIKTVCVLLMGWLFFQDMLTAQKFMGICLTVMGMILYGWAAEKAKNAPVIPKQEHENDDIAFFKNEEDSDDLELGYGAKKLTA